MSTTFKCTIVCAAAGVGIGLIAGCEEDSTTAPPATSVGTSGGSGGTGTGGEGTGASGGGGGSPACQAGDVQDCYDGPMGTEGVGICVGGTQTCASDGNWGACDSQVLPDVEDCTAIGDEDCDGIACSEPVWDLIVNGVADSDEVTDVAVDSMGNVIVTGRFSSPKDFGSGLFTPTNSFDMFIAKYDASGQHVWSKHLQSNSTGFPMFVQVASGDALVLAAAVLEHQTIDFGNGGVGSSGTSRDIVLAKLDAGGNHVWSQVLGNWNGQSHPTGNRQLLALALDPNDDSIAVAGSYTGTWGCSTSFCNGSNDDAGFLRKYDSSGTLSWGRNYDGNGLQAVTGMAIGSGGDIAIAGTTRYGTINLTNGHSIVVNGSSYEGWVARLDTTGATQWSLHLDASGGRQEPAAIVWTSATEFVVGGRFFSGIDLGGTVTSAGSADMFLAQFNTSDQLVWHHTYGGSGLDNLRDVGIDGTGQLLIAGGFDDAIDLGLGTMDPTGTHAAVVAKYQPNGTITWAKVFGDSGETRGLAVAGAPDGSVVCSGWFDGEIDLGFGMEQTMSGKDGWALALQP